MSDETSPRTLTALLGTPVTSAKGRMRGRLRDVAVGTGADAGRVAGLVLKTRKGLEIVSSREVPLDSQRRTRTASRKRL